MEVASLENCKKLYELSGWKPEYWKRNVVGVHEYLYTKMKVKNSDPAYDLGFMLRKLPTNVWGGYDPHLFWRDGKWKANYYTGNRVEWHSEADTPEDACVLLCIKLFESGILTKE